MRPKREPKKYKYILIDWDGNIAQTLDAWFIACKLPLVKRNPSLSDARIIEGFNDTKLWGVDDLEDVFKEADYIAETLLPDIKLYPDALEVIEKLYQRGKKLAIVTTAPRKNVDFILKKYKFSRYFDAIVTGDDVTFHKPHTEPLEKALQLMGGKKEKAIIVGDSDKDLDAARKLGIDSILFFPVSNQKFYNLEQLNKSLPTYVLQDFKTILDII